MLGFVGCEEIGDGVGDLFVGNGVGVVCGDGIVFVWSRLCWLLFMKG